jgi:hypothetical protein
MGQEKWSMREKSRLEHGNEGVEEPYGIVFSLVPFFFLFRQRQFILLWLVKTKTLFHSIEIDLHRIGNFGKRVLYPVAI